MLEPADCPYCSEAVENMRPHRLRPPADGRDDYPMEAAEGMESQDSVSFDEVKGVEVVPCGHVFRESDIEAYRSGELRAEELGDRVQNPGVDR